MDDSSREDSPDWVRAFQTPTKAALTLSSPSDSSLAGSDLNEDRQDNERDDAVSLPKHTSTAISAQEKPKAKSALVKKRKTDNHSPTTGKEGSEKTAKHETVKKSNKTHEPSSLVWMVSSDSESCPEASLVKEENVHDKELSRPKTAQYSDKEKVNATVSEETLQVTSKRKSPKKRKREDQLPTKKKLDSHVKGENDDDMDVPEEEISAKPAGPYVSSSSLPLVLPEKVQRSKALVECEGDSIDLSGDVGAVGRVIISDNQDMLLDLKGTIYKTTIVPSRTFCVVSFGQSEAKIEAIMNDFIQLKPESNVYEAETMVEGTLDGFSFDSEDEADNLPKGTANQNDQNEGAEEKHNVKGKGNAEKKTASGRKKGKSVGAKPPKKAKKKVQAAKKTKAKK